MELADEQIMLQSLAIAVIPQDENEEGEAVVLTDSVAGLIEEGVAEVTDDTILDVGSSSVGVGIRLLPMEIVGNSLTAGNGGGTGGGYIYKWSAHTRSLGHSLLLTPSFPIPNSTKPPPSIPGGQKKQ